MKKQTIEVFKWFDIQKEICNKMSISTGDFRSYNNIVGGDRKDLWIEWINFFELQVMNDHIIFNDLGETKESKIEWVSEFDKGWLIPFINAVYEVWDEYGIEYVKYGW